MVEMTLHPGYWPYKNQLIQFHSCWGCDNFLCARQIQSLFGGVGSIQPTD